MMDEKQLEKAYRKLQHQAAPDLWERIEGNLKEHPERAMGQNTVNATASLTKKPVRQKRILAVPAFLRGIPPFEMTAVAAAMVVLIVAVPRFSGPESNKEMMAETTGAVLAETAAETMAEVLAEAEPSAKAAPAADDRGRQIVTISQLELADSALLPVPANARTLPEDTLYFSEGILRDTGLLASGTVETAALEYDDTQKAIMVVYELTLDQIYFAEDYISETERITVRSPIVQTQGDQAYILYQLQPGGTYLLPLAKQESGWELLYPFAPQIQITGNGDYLFHSGYTSLVNEATTVVIGSQEGPNDYYYDRMLLREDQDFPYDLAALIAK